MNPSTPSSEESSRQRTGRDTALMEIAGIIAQRSTCLRLTVGALVAREGRILVTGYNGAPAGTPHCTPENCGPDTPCIRAVHAEANCIAFAAKFGISLRGAEMFTTDSPCSNCSHLIINSGIIKVTYKREYRDLTPLNWLQTAGVKTLLYE